MAATNRSEQLTTSLIVGGGVIGLACAWRAAERGLRVKRDRARPARRRRLERRRRHARARGRGELGRGPAARAGARLASPLARVCRRAGRGERTAMSATSTSARCTSRSTATRRPSCGAVSS